MYAVTGVVGRDTPDGAPVAIADLGLERVLGSQGLVGDGEDIIGQLRLLWRFGGDC